MFDSMEERVSRLEMAAEAQRLIGLYSSYMTLKEFQKIPELFAMDAQQTYAEMLWGVYDGADGVRRLYEGLFPALEASGEKQVVEALQAMEVPIITAAQDGKTAKAVWVCPGYATVMGKDGVKTGYWSWQKCACDFLRTDAGVKIWHLHIYGLFECAYGTSDVLPSGTVAYGSSIPAAFAPDRPPTTRFDLSDDSIYPYTPAIPKPYTVFDQDYAY